MNNHTTARQPLRPVAENTEVLRQQIEGEITREGQGPFLPVNPPQNTSDDEAT